VPPSCIKESVMGLFGSSLNVSPADFPDAAEVLAPGEETAPGLAVLAGGCFWCTEVVYRELDGVQAVVSGYAGGSRDTADYDSVCTGRTDHAEVIQVVYDPARVGYDRLLKVFFSVAHDPTQLDRQGNDVGHQYRSAIFYANEAQHRVAAAYIRQLDGADVFKAPIVTRLEPLQAFFEAEHYHQNYAALNPGQPYIAAVAMPKVDKLRAYFGASLKR